MVKKNKSSTEYLLDNANNEHLEADLNDRVFICTMPQLHTKTILNWTSLPGLNLAAVRMSKNAAPCKVRT